MYSLQLKITILLQIEHTTQTKKGETMRSGILLNLLLCIHLYTNQRKALQIWPHYYLFSVQLNP